MTKKDIFKHNMLRSYNEDIFYNLFKKEDVAEIRSVVKFAEGLIIKNTVLADKFETNSSLHSANTYLSAMDNLEMHNGSMSELQKKSIIQGYREGNPYYLFLNVNYGITPYEARKAKNFHIIKPTNNTLNPQDTDLFYQCYYDMLEYFEKVTVTTAFDNQTFIHEYYINYIIFGTILRYITRRMEYYFDVDTYDRRDLKNGFISWGMDYFDEIPLEYQRRIYKAINSLIRNKGTDNALQIINDLFSFQNVSINKYTLAKVKDTTDPFADDKLALYKTPFDEKLDIDENEQIDLGEIIEADPYWRSTPEEILDFNFNTINTKYISADINIDLSSSSKGLSYYISLLNDAELIDRDLIRNYIGTDKGLSKRDAKKLHGILDDDFYFNDVNISPAPIYFFDAIVALTSLIFKEMNYSDRIHRVNHVKHIYGYNYNHDFSEDMNEVRDYLYWNKRNFPSSKWNEYMRFFSSFRLKTISRYNQIDLNDVIEEYDTNIRYYNQLLYVSELVEEANGNTKIKEYVENDAIYDAITLLINMMMDSSRGVPLDILFQYVDLHSLMSNFVAYQLSVGILEKDRLYDGFKNNLTIRKELNDFKVRVNKPELTSLINGYLAVDKPTNDIVENLINRLLNFLYRYPEVEKHDLTFTQNLFVYLTIFTYSEDRNFDNRKISLQELSSIYRYNENLRLKLEEYMYEETDPVLYEKMKVLWDNSFVTDFDMGNYKFNNTLSTYLTEHDPNLYEYIQVSIPVYDFQSSKKPLYREKVFALANAIDTYLQLNDNLLAKNNFVGMSDFVRRYVRILLEIFKAYTLQVIDSNISYSLKHPVDNGVKLRDQITMSHTNIFLTDQMSVIDTARMNSSTVMTDNIEVTDEIILTVNED